MSVLLSSLMMRRGSSTTFKSAMIFSVGISFTYESFGCIAGHVRLGRVAPSSRHRISF